MKGATFSVVEIPRFADLAVVHRDRLGHTLDETPPFDLHGQRFVYLSAYPFHRRG